MEHPIDKFNALWQAATQGSPLRQKNAVCVSTLTKDGYPSGRFVDLKAVSEEGFTFCTYLDSSKGQELADNSKAAMTIWWDHTALQVRVIGIAARLSDHEAMRHWDKRSRDAQVTTLSCQQSQTLESEADLQLQLEATRSQWDGKEIPKPDNWGGFCIQPKSIEFLTFKASRLHLRELYVSAGRAWEKSLLQP